VDIRLAILAKEQSQHELSHGESHQLVSEFNAVEFIAERKTSEWLLQNGLNHRLWKLIPPRNTRQPSPPAAATS
jgi:hypothetical protein